MDIEEQVQHFLWRHRQANDIVWDAEWNRPVKAVYTTLDGMPRKFPAEFYFTPDNSY